jgi:hypothetical protein
MDNHIITSDVFNGVDLASNYSDAIQPMSYFARKGARRKEPAFDNGERYNRRNWQNNLAMAMQRQHGVTNRKTEKEIEEEDKLGQILLNSSRPSDYPMPEIVMSRHFAASRASFMQGAIILLPLAAYAYRDKPPKASVAVAEQYVVLGDDGMAYEIAPPKDLSYEN